MIPLLALGWLLAPLPAGAEAPDFGSGGLAVAVEYGPGFWSLSREALLRQAPTHAADVDAFLADLQDTHTLSLQVRYSIKGHVSLGGDLTATGWNLADVTRGGGGFVTGTLAWHPLQLVYALLQEPRALGLDLSTSFGAGYGLAGQRRGMDGAVFEWAFTADWFFTRFFSLGAFVRGVFLDWSSLYVNFANRGVAGNTIPLPEHSGGSFWTFGGSLTFRAGD